MRVHDLVSLSSPRVEALCNDAAAGPLLAVLPLGATEQHGPHLPLGTDSMIINGVLARTRLLLDADPAPGEVLLLPTQVVGLSKEHQSFAGTLSLSPNLALDAWFTLLQPLAAWGLQRILLFNGHGGQAALTEVLAQRLDSELGLTAIWCHVDGLGEPDGLIPAEERRIGLHGGLIETSLMLALQPDLVDMAQAEDFASCREVVTRGNRYLRSGGVARHAWQAQELNPAGVVGCALDADASLGRKLLDHRAKALAQVIQEALRFSLKPLLKRN